MISDYLDKNLLTHIAIHRPTGKLAGIVCSSKTGTIYKSSIQID